MSMLRPVKFKADYNIASRHGLTANSEYGGYLLGFWPATPPSVSIMTALVELENGNVVYVPADKVTFTDRYNN